MASRATHLPALGLLKSDRATLEALKEMAAYAPHDPNLSPQALADLEAALCAAEDAVHRVRRAYNAVRIELNRIAWAFHDRSVSARLAVKAQFGADSYEVRAVGLKRSSERKRRPRRAKPSAPEHHPD
jgi:hypothetical protein